MDLDPEFAARIALVAHRGEHAAVRQHYDAGVEMLRRAERAAPPRRATGAARRRSCRDRGTGRRRGWRRRPASGSAHRPPLACMPNSITPSSRTEYIDVPGIESPGKSQLGTSRCGRQVRPPSVDARVHACLGFINIGMPPPITSVSLLRKSSGGRSDQSDALPPGKSFSCLMPMSKTGTTDFLSQVRPLSPRADHDDLARLFHQIIVVDVLIVVGGRA